MCVGETWEVCISVGHSTTRPSGVRGWQQRRCGEMQLPRLTKQNGHTAFVHSLSFLQAAFDTPDIVSGVSATKRGLRVDSTGLTCHLTRTYKGLSRRLILMPTYRCSVHAEVVLAFVQRDGSQSYPARDRNTGELATW
jgi:hypothetical protein